MAGRICFFVATCVYFDQKVVLCVYKRQAWHAEAAPAGYAQGQGIM
jgi:hypothetical protein